MYVPRKVNMTLTVRSVVTYMALIVNDVASLGITSQTWAFDLTLKNCFLILIEQPLRADVANLDSTVVWFCRLPPRECPCAYYGI